MTKAYDEAVVAQAEQSSQIVTLMSQVRDLRAARDEAEADRAALVTAKRSLEQRLEEIGTEYLSANSGKYNLGSVLWLQSVIPVLQLFDTSSCRRLLWK